MDFLFMPTLAQSDLFKGSSGMPELLVASL